MAEETGTAAFHPSLWKRQFTIRRSRTMDERDAYLKNYTDQSPSDTVMQQET
ncbi:MAG: hypothetical protein U1F68_08965 [Gammaproteobacteria bacterium]